MFLNHVRLLTRVTMALLIGGSFWLAATSADAPRDRKVLDDAKRINDVAGQKMEVDVRAALNDSQRLALTDPAKAAERLKKTLAVLEGDTSLSASRKETLVKMMRSCIRTMEAFPDVKPMDEKQLAATIRKVELSKPDEKKQAEDEKIRQSLNTIVSLQKDGNIAEARRMADDLAKQYPGNSAAANAVSTMRSFDQLASARTARTDKEQRTNDALRDIDRAATPPKGDIEFNAKVTKANNESPFRNKPSSVTLTVREKAIMKALSTPVTVTFKGERFQDVIDYLTTAIGQPILLDKQALSDVNVDYDTPITLSVKGATVRTLLRKILQDQGLAYIVKDEAIQVTSLAKAQSTMTVRSYYLGDLMIGVGGGPGDPLTGIYGPGIGQVQAMQNITAIMDMIQTTVEPQSWQPNGGLGSLFFHYPSMSLVVRQSAEVHNMIGGGLGR